MPLAVDSFAVLRDIYGEAIGLHHDLYLASNAHREEHGGTCDVYPSDPANASCWPFLAAVVRARRFLEIGCGLGYTAALMAEAGGPSCHVDTIESVPAHADLAEAAFRRKGLSGRIRVLRGRDVDTLPTLRTPYDIAFVDADFRVYPQLLPHLARLTRVGGILVSANLGPLFGGWGPDIPGKDAIRDYLAALARDPRFRTFVVPDQWHAMSYRLRPSGPGTRRKVSRHIRKSSR